MQSQWKNVSCNHVTPHRPILTRIGSIDSTLSFKDNRFICSRRRNALAPYWQCRAYCRHSSNCIKVKMTIKQKPGCLSERVPVTIYVSGRYTHADGIDNNDDEDVRLLPNIGDNCPATVELQQLRHSVKVASRRQKITTEHSVT